MAAAFPRKRGGWKAKIRGMALDAAAGRAKR
jgi:hypothetical protein